MHFFETEVKHKIQKTCNHLTSSHVTTAKLELLINVEKKNVNLISYASHDILYNLLTRMETQLKLSILFTFQMHKSCMRDLDITDYFLVLRPCACQNFTTLPPLAKAKILASLSTSMYGN